MVLTIILLVCLPVSADQTSTGGDTLTNPTSTTTAISSAPYITIDPIGNYTIGNVLNINGTTNLPVNTSLFATIFPDSYSPGYRGPEQPAFFLTNISIVSTPSGINLWSVNATDIGISGLPVEWSPYLVTVEIPGLAAGAIITVLPAPNPTLTSVGTNASMTSLPINPSPAQTTQTTTQSSPLPTAMPIAVIAASVIIRPLYRKKE
ncbi:hypothetical protein [Methanoregula sp.]|uniref:hypothetical protein n=1 Tax=Methanoregula sp. TaxID=2052170 RepID=UPI003BB005B7